jgi:two-component system chemotaxis sensor kinase CheA
VAQFTPYTYTITGEAEILSEFMVEAEDHLSKVESILLEQTGSFSNDTVDAIFRSVHSIKGGSSYFSLKEVTETSHKIESFMDHARNGKIAFNSIPREVILDYIALQRKLLKDVDRAMRSDFRIEASQMAFDFTQTIADLLLAVEHVDGIRADIFKSPGAATSQGNLAEAGPIHQAGTAESSDEAGGGKRSGDKLKVKDFVKIETNRLDHLIEFIGEMVISSSMLIKNCRDFLPENDEVIANTNQLERISREIQDIGMSMRLIPVKGLFQKMSRVVWDTSKKVGKRISFEMEGEDTELDRSVLDKLADPLMHMVRNAVDHGVEPESERVAAGKPAAGAVRLSAYHSGGKIYIEVKDDGRGLARHKILKKAIEKGIVASGDGMSDEDVFMLIFAAGFSTAETVTDVSGRGVGMDVVRRNIESMRGRVSIASTEGAGSVFTIELPLTLAIIEGIETEISNQRYIIPSLSVIEFLRPSRDMILHTLDRGETLKYRGNFLPIYRVANIFDLTQEKTDICDSIVVISEVGGKLVALQVNAVLGKLSTVIKSLGGLYDRVEGVSGCAVLPDGEIGLILDVGTFVNFAKQDARVTDALGDAYLDLEPGIH